MASEVIKREIRRLSEFKTIYRDLFNSNEYLEYEYVYSKLSASFPSKLEFKINFLFSLFQYRHYEKLFFELRKIMLDLRKKIDEHNKNIIAMDIKKFKDICGKVEGNYLDGNQIDSIVRKNKNQLVFAGAGSGKTTTIVGKVKYLLATGMYNPKDILLLSFTHASALEMRERIKVETGFDLDVFTFHKLSLDIIKKGTIGNLNVFDKDLYYIIRDFIVENMKKPQYFDKLIYFLSTLRFDLKDEFDFSSEDEYNEYLKTNKTQNIKQ